ncbi:hypothetical protein AB4Z22_13205, partial [Paenibacillus sp. TAF58]
VQHQAVSFQLPNKSNKLTSPSAGQPSPDPSSLDLQIVHLITEDLLFFRCLPAKLASYLLETRQ